MRYIGPRNKVARREGVDLELKTPGSKSHGRLLKKLNVKPGQHGLRTRRKISEHTKQLREKQKLRYMFGISEKQLKNYFKQGALKKGNTAKYLCQFLEKRFDNLVYRVGFAPTRAAARQLIVHGHFKIGVQKLSIPSYQTKIDDIITFSHEKATKIPYIEKLLNNKDSIIPVWLERQGLSCKLVKEPDSNLIDKQINLRSVIEFYSR